MKTALDIDDELLAEVASIAKARDLPLDSVLSELVRKGLGKRRRTFNERNGLPVFQVPPDSKPIALADVERWEDEV